MLLAPSAVQNFRDILLTKIGVKSFPITHINKFRQVTFVDINNLCGRGCNAVYSASGNDRSQLLMVASSVEEYLSSHYQALKQRRLYEQGGVITSFRKHPQEVGGSVAVSQGAFMVEA